MATGGIGIDEISRMLAGKGESVTAMLLPGGKRINGHWVCGDLLGSPGQSLKVELNGSHTGKWRDWAGDGRGDLLDLWAAVRGVPLPEACQQARQWLGLPMEVRPAREKAYTQPKETKEAQANGRIRTYLREQRCIEDKILNQFRIGAHVRERDGVKQGFVVYPSYAPNGVHINNCYIGLDRTPEGKKIVFQDTGCAPSMFGWQALSARAFETRTVIICEGQIDCMTWTQWGLDCLSIPNGGGNTWIEYEWDNLSVFSTIYLSYDMDGKLSDVQESAISRLGKHRCRLIQLPHKDANAALQAKFTAEEAGECVKAARAPKLANFTSLTDIKDRVIEHFFPSDTEKKLIQPDVLKGPYADKTFTIRPGELTVWTGIANHGKSTLLAQVFIELVILRQVVMITSLEMKPERIVKKMALCFANGGTIGRSDLDEFLAVVGERICFCDKVGSVKIEELFDMMRFAYARYGATQFLIDSMMRIEGLEEDYKAQGTFMNRLCQFATENMVHIHLVAHPRKTAEDARPSANDLKGSSLIRNGADNVIVVHRNIEKEKRFAEGEITLEQFQGEWDTSVIVDKDREEGNVKAFKYRFDKGAQRFNSMLILPPAPKAPKEKRNWHK